MKKYIWVLPALVLLASCEKEIDMDYRSIDKLYVIEGSVTNLGTEVLITRTRDMDDGMKGEGIDGALVTVTSNDGIPETLIFDEETGKYLSNLIGEPGKTYTLTVSIDGQQFVSSSTMQKEFEIEPLEFLWMRVMGERILMCSMYIHDIPDEENFYFLRIRKNGKNYRWGLLFDRGNDGTLLSADTFCMLEENERDEEDIIYEGDIMTLEVRNIDRRSYDYFYSLAISEDTSSNPIDNFTGGCLGYFSAYSVSRQETVFRFDDVLPES